MNKLTITVTPFPKGAVVEHHGISEIFLERQGSGQAYYGGVRNGDMSASIELVQLSKDPDQVCIEVGIHDKKIPNKVIACSRMYTKGVKTHATAEFHPDPQAAACEFIKKHTGAKVVFNPTRLAYMHEQGGDTSHVLLSTMVYEPGSDTIRSTKENYCLVAFKDGKFDERDLHMDAAATAYTPFIEDALRKGFGVHEQKMGDDYCKRRLAWLAGAMQIDGLIGQEVDLGVLNPKMEWIEASIVTLAPPKKMSMRM